MFLLIPVALLLCLPALPLLLWDTGPAFMIPHEQTLFPNNAWSSAYSFDWHWKGSWKFIRTSYYNLKVSFLNAYKFTPHNTTHKIQIASSTFPQHTHTKLPLCLIKYFYSSLWLAFPFIIPKIIKKKTNKSINSKLSTHFSFKNGPERGKHHNPMGLHWWFFSTLKSDHLFLPLVSCFLEVIYWNRELHTLTCNNFVQK